MCPQVIDVKQEVEMRDIAHTEKINKSADEDYMYMKVTIHIYEHTVFKILQGQWVFFQILYS